MSYDPAPRSSYSFPGSGNNLEYDAAMSRRRWAA
jgi:hypothetical protein